MDEFNKDKFQVNLIYLSENSDTRLNDLLSEIKDKGILGLYKEDLIFLVRAYSGKILIYCRDKDVRDKVTSYAYRVDARYTIDYIARILTEEILPEYKKYCK